MPKITRHGGASDRRESPAPEPSAEHVEGSEQPSPGSSSEISTERPPSSPETSEMPLPKRARTTGSRSGKGRPASSTAGSAGSPTEADAS